MCSTPQHVQLDGTIELENIIKMQGGGGHLLLLDKTGQMYGCGWNSKGQLGLCNTEDSFVIKQLPKTDAPIVDIACGWDSSAAIDHNGNLYVWGSNAFDQLGYSANCIDSEFTFPMILFLPSNEKAKQVCFGLRYMCILSESHNIYVIGRWRFLDICKTIIHNDTNFYQINNPTNFMIKSISSGSNHIICEYTDNSSSIKLVGFGDNKFSQCKEQKLKDVVVRSFRSGWSHNGILTKNGKVFLWGRNTYGQLGNADGDNSDHLVELNGIDEKIDEIHLGSEHGLIRTEQKNIFTWGWNEHGNCGNGNETNV